MKGEFKLTENRMPVIECRNLTKTYEDGLTAVDQVNFTINEGEIFAMLGANGAGKTTTINIFLNFIEPTGGDTLVCGHSCHEEPLTAKKYLSYVSENVMLYPHFTAIQNLDFFTRIGAPQACSYENYTKVLDRVGLQTEAHHKKVGNFSKGMRQKCAIAIAILKNAPAVLLDEPTSGLDPQAGLEFIDLLNSLKKEGKAILISTHDIFRAKSIADTIGIMHQGKLVVQKSRQEFRNEDLEQLYMAYMGN